MDGDLVMGPLHGTTVLDLTRVLSGPYCTMALGDLGARVIKLEHPGRGDDTRRWGPPFLGDESAYFLSVNRNKESVAIDFKSAGGREVVERLLAKADVVVENFRPGTLDALGLDAASVRARHPKIVYCSISGYGQTGPRREEPGYDAVMQAEGGLMSITGAADGPPYRLGVAIVVYLGWGLLVGGLAYGWAPFTNPAGGVLGWGELLPRLAIAAAYLFVTLLQVAGIAFVLGVRTDAPLGAVGVAVLVAIVSSILGQIDSLGDLRNGLPLHYIRAWQDLLTPQVDWTAMGHGVLWSVLYTLLTVGLAFAVFRRKDVLS